MVEKTKLDEDMEDLLKRLKEYGDEIGMEDEEDESWMDPYDDDYETPVDDDEEEDE